MKGGSEQQLMTPLPEDSEDPLDPVACSKLVFCVRETLLLPLVTLSRPLSCFYKTETARLCSPEIRMSLFGRKKAPAGALSPSTVLLRGILSFSKTKQLYCVITK